MYSSDTTVSIALYMQSVSVAYLYRTEWVPHVAHRDPALAHALAATHMHEQRSVLPLDEVRILW